MKLLVAIIVLCHLCSGAAWAADLTVVVGNVKNDQGHLIVSLFSQKQSEAFPAKSEKSFRKKTIPAHEGRQTLTFENIDYGQYAVAVIHDENDNGKLDRNSAGMPEEGFGYSNHPAISFGFPPFDACAFSVSEDAHEVSIVLGY